MRSCVPRTDASSRMLRVSLVAIIPPLCNCSLIPCDRKILAGAQPQAQRREGYGGKDASELNTIWPHQPFHCVRGCSTNNCLFDMDLSPSQPLRPLRPCRPPVCQTSNGLYTSRTYLRYCHALGGKQHHSWFRMGERECSPNCPFHLTARSS